MIILASGSPRRRELLARLCDFEVRPSNCDENCTCVSPSDYVLELSKRKALAAKAGMDDTVIAADTVVALEGEILNKPRDSEDAAKMLRRLSGKTHHVYTGVTVKRNGEIHSFFEKTAVTFFELSDELIAGYVASGEPLDKAGAYGIQGKGCLLVKNIEGDFFNVVGLPAARLYRLLKDIGVDGI